MFPKIPNINGRNFTYILRPIEMEYGYTNCAVIQEINWATPFQSQTLSEYSTDELNLQLSNSISVTVFPECGLPILLMLQSQGKL